MLRERAAENAAQVESAYGGTVGKCLVYARPSPTHLLLRTAEPMPSLNSDGEDDDWNGVSSSSKGKQKQQEYEDEEVLATVAVVEDFDPDSLIHGTDPIPRPSENVHPVPVKSVPRTSNPQSVPSKSKSRPQKIRYQTKDARKHEKSKQHTRKLEKAELAGGKASRRKGVKKGKGRK